MVKEAVQQPFEGFLLIGGSVVGWSCWEPLVIAALLSRSLEVLDGRSDVGMVCSLRASRKTSSVSQDT